jgi:hypothetical protein
MWERSWRMRMSSFHFLVETIHGEVRSSRKGCPWLESRSVERHSLRVVRVARPGNRRDAVHVDSAGPARRAHKADRSRALRPQRRGQRDSGISGPHAASKRFHLPGVHQNVPKTIPVPLGYGGQTAKAIIARAEVPAKKLLPSWSQRATLPEPLQNCGVQNHKWRRPLTVSVGQIITPEVRLNACEQRPVTARAIRSRRLVQRSRTHRSSKPAASVLAVHH